MAATISPSRTTVLPPVPFDGQIFVDQEFIKWVYNAEDKLWTRIGQVDSIPVATAESSGLLSATDKAFIDSLPAVGGGFGIIVSHSELLLAGPDNPDGVIVGDIELTSESLDIVCFGTSRTATPNRESCGQVNCEGSPLVDVQPPGIGFKLSEKFLKSMTINVAGPTGPIGDTGVDGLDGLPGTFLNGPKGLKGPAGADAIQACTLKGFTYEDVPGIFSEAVVDFKISQSCQIVLTKSAIALTDDNNPPSHVLATQLIRSLTYADQTDPCVPVTLDDWQLTEPITDTTPLDMVLIRLPNDGDCTKGQSITGMKLSDFIRDIVNIYKLKLAAFEQNWLNQVQQFVNQQDGAARGILSNLSQQLLDCQQQECLAVPPATKPAASLLQHTDTSEVINLQNVTTATIKMGQVITVKAAKTMGLADSAGGLSLVGYGLAVTDIVPNAIGQVRVTDVLTNNDWTAATGAATLVPGQSYFLNGQGLMSTTPPITTGSIQQEIGRAITPQSLEVTIKEPVLIESQ